MLHPAIFDVTFLRFNTCFTFSFLFKKDDGTIMPASLMEQFGNVLSFFFSLQCNISNELILHYIKLNHCYRIQEEKNPSSSKVKFLLQY